MPNINIIVFDYGGVVAEDYCEPYSSQLATMLKVSIETIETLVSETSQHGARFRLAQIDLLEFWQEVSTIAGIRAIDAHQAQKLWAQTFVPRSSILMLMEELKRISQSRIAIFKYRFAPGAVRPRTCSLVRLCRRSFFLM